MKNEVCPCCGYATLGTRARSEVCVICNWKDDGRDNSLAFQYSGKNHTNLNLARYQYLMRPAEMKRATRARRANHRLPEAGFERCRFFSIGENGGYIQEKNKNGHVVYNGPIPFVDYAKMDNDQVAAIPMRIRLK